MAASEWLSDAFLASVKRRGNLPTSINGWDEEDFFALATDEMRDYLVPLLRKQSEEFFVTTYDVGIVAGTATYDIPDWASSEALRDVQVDDGNGGYVSLARRQPADVSSNPGNGTTRDFYLRDDSVVLVPTPAATGTLRMLVVRRPLKLVSVDRCYKVTAIAAPTLTVTPLGSQTTTIEEDPVWVDRIFGIVSALRFRTLYSSEVFLVSNNTITPSGGASTITSSGVAVGDYICIPGESPVPQLPAEWHGLLAQSVVCAYLRAATAPGLEAAQAKLAAMESHAVSGVNPRTENQPRYIQNPFNAYRGPRYGPR